MIVGTIKFRIMKKRLFFIGVAILTLCTSCSDELESSVKNPVQTGDEILFGSSLSVADENSESRTVYGTRDNLGVNVHWDPEGDEVAIFCLQTSQPADHLVNYLVKPSDSDPATAGTVAKIKTDEAGLQWGAGDEHRFYAFYPASAVKGSDEENQTGKITANIPVTQQVQSWRTVEAGKEGAIDGMKTYFGLPNMDYAYMYAFKKVSKSEVAQGGTVDLQFHNLVTVLDITVRGPEEGSVTVTNVNVSAVSGNPILTGDFTCNIRAAEEGNAVSATCEAAGDLNEVRNVISIPCYNRTEGEYITLGKNECLNVKAYLIPDDNADHVINPRTLKISVATLNGGSVKTRTLEQSAVTPHKINRVLLPKLIPGGTNYWMSSLDKNVYLSELSLPGSKMSVLTEENGSDIIYQNATIEQQFKDGVRAFILQTQRVYDSGIFPAKYRLDVYGGKGSVMTLKEALANIASYLKNAYEVEKKTNEYAFVLLTYQSGSGSGSDWFNLLQDEINEIKDDPTYRIFNGEITPSTTLGEVGGKIVLKANYNDADMISGNDKTAPMMYTLWETAYVPNGLDMTWGNPFNPAKLTWLYQEATAVKTGGSVDGNATYDEKIKYIKEIFQKSVDAYKNDDDHKIWFFNDLGGYYYEAHKNLIGQTVVDREDPIALALELNQLGVSELQNRAENAGLGLVFMNYADKQSESGVKYKSDWLIQTVIDNNFKFALRKKDSSRTPTYNASYKSGGNAVGWDE